MRTDHLTRHQIVMHSSSSYVALTSAAATLASSTMTTVTMAPTTTVMSSSDTTKAAMAKTSTSAITSITSISVTPIVTTATTTALTHPLNVATSSVSTTCTFADSNSSTLPPALHDNHNNLISSSQHLSSKATTSMNSSDSHSITSVHSSHLSTNDTGLKRNDICFKHVDSNELSIEKPSREKTVTWEYQRKNNATVDDTNQFGSDHGRVSPCQARWKESYNFGVLHHPEVQLSQLFYDTLVDSIGLM